MPEAVSWQFTLFVYIMYKTCGTYNTTERLEDNVVTTICFLGLLLLLLLQV